MDMIDGNTAVVYDHSDLSEAIGSDNGIDYIYLGADITMSLGITVHSSKTTLVIDGLYPPQGAEIRTLKDSGGDSGTVMIRTTVNITFQNLIISGLNYYGMPRVYDLSANENTVVTYSHVTYSGPQMTWHVNGRTRYLDCDVTIMHSGGSIMHEVAEVRWVDIGGNTVIRHNNPNGWPVFLFRKTGASLTILEGANVEISTDYDFLQREGVYPQFTIEPHASFFLTTQRGISRDSGHYVSSFLVDKGATFRYIRRTTDGATAALYVSGAFTVNEGGKVYMQADFENNGQLLRFRTGNPGGLYLNKPKSFVLYNRGTQTNAAALHFESLKTFSFDSKQVNFWRTATLFPLAGTFDDIPEYQWRMPDWSYFEITGEANTSETTAASPTAGFPEEPKLSELRLDLARVLSVGELTLTVDPVIIEERNVTGNTDPEARVLVTYTSSSIVCRVECEVEDDSIFVASLEDEEEVTFGTAVAVTSNLPFLLTSLTVEARYDEDLHITAPEVITFAVKPISLSPVILTRVIEDPENPEYVTVTDSRETKTPWKIWAKLESPLETDEGDVLSDAVVYGLESGELITLGTGAESEVYYDSNQQTETSILWEENEGILARITDTVRSGKRYTTQLIWSVRPE